MIKEIVNKWQENKRLLEEEIKNTNQNKISYEWLVEKIAKIIVEYEEPIVHTIDDGDYQGTLLFIITNKDFYQPNEHQYITTFVGYGSCSNCDTLEGIREYDNDTPNEKQLKQYMTLCLHIVQKMKYFRK